MADAKHPMDHENPMLKKIKKLVNERELPPRPSPEDSERDAVAMHAEIMGKLDDAGKAAQATICRLLWLLYVTSENEEIGYGETEKDVTSDRNAAMIVDGLGVAGLRITKAN